MHQFSRFSKYVLSASTNLLAVLCLVSAFSVRAENYESCLAHDSQAYLEAFKSALDQQNISHVSVVTDGRTAVCVLPSDEAAVLEIAKRLAGSKI